MNPITKLAFLKFCLNQWGGELSHANTEYLRSHIRPQPQLFSQPMSRTKPNALFIPDPVLYKIIECLCLPVVPSPPILLITLKEKEGLELRY